MKREGGITLSYGLAIKLKRIEKKVKQKDLAHKVGITPQYLSQIENGIADNPSIGVISTIAKELQVEVYTLFQ